MRLTSFLLFATLASTVDAQSIVTSGGNRSIVTSGAAAVVQSKPKPTGPTEADLLRLEVDFLKSSLAAATAPNPAPVPVPVVVTPPVVVPQTGNYIVAFTASWCGPCRTWKSIELPKLKAAGVAVRIVDVDQEPQWGVSSLPTFWVVDRKTRRALRKFNGSTSAAVLQANISAAVSTPTTVAKPVQSRSRLPVVRTRWGTIDLETYHKNCNCEMCQGIRALQRQYRQQYNPTSMPAPPAELDFADIGQDATPDDLIDQAVAASNLQSSDVLADPGCGDGRVLIAYVKKSGCRGIGVEIDPIKADEARANIAEANLADRISVITGDALDFDPSAHGVTAIFVHLYDDLLEKLAPKFRQPGIRVVVTPYHQVPGLTMQQHGDVWVYRPTAIRSSSGLFGHIGTSHESRETLVNHLMTEGEHRGRHSAGDLARMSDEQLDALHSRDHALLN